jgi:helix-turn-helix protein
MSSVLADFTARFDVDSAEIATPTEGRVILGSEQLVLVAGDDEQLRLPLSGVVDIRTGAVPQVFDPLPGTPVTVTIKYGGTHWSTLLAAEETTVRKFSSVLFKAVLNGAAVTIKHPAKLGGRVLDADFRGGVLAIETGAVTFETGDGPVSIALDAVIDFNRTARVIDDQERKVVVVDHMHTDEAMTTVVAVESARLLTVLGRFLRREYQKQMAALADLSLSEAETEVMTAIYSTGEEISLTSVLGIDPEKTRHILHSLHESELIESGDNGPVLTPRGQVVVNQYLERVNE